MYFFRFTLYLADFIRLKLNSILKKKLKIGFDASFGGLRGNVRTSSLARWKTCHPFPIYHTLTVETL